MIKDERPVREDPLFSTGQSEYRRDYYGDEDESMLIVYLFGALIFLAGIVVGGLL